METITLDQAIEVLEVTDISKITEGDLSKIAKKAKLRWHPDRIAATDPKPEVVERYEINFAKVDDCVEVIKAYLRGEYKAGEKYSQKQDMEYREPEEIIRENSSHIQSTLQGLWAKVKEVSFMKEVKEVIIADGIKVKDLLMADLEDGVPAICVEGLLYGQLMMLIPLIISAFLGEALMGIVGIFAFIQAISCIICFIPLARFWLPESLFNILSWFVNIGYEFGMRIEGSSQNPFINLAIIIPRIIGRLIHYVVMYPLYHLAAAILQDKVVGEIKENITYYAGLADWYIEDIIKGDALTYNSDQLFDLSYLYTQLSKVNQ